MEIVSFGPELVRHGRKISPCKTGFPLCGQVYDPNSLEEYWILGL